MPDRQISPYIVRSAGFATGVIVPLLLMGLISAVWSGGLSDRPASREPVYVIE